MSNKVVLCHGTFDLLHLGHVKHFQEASKLGDKLVVSVTGDKHVKKGPNRPYFNQNQRLEMIQALNVVDEAFITESDSAVDAINKVKPSIYVKGSEYKRKIGTGSKLDKEIESVEKVGGVIAFVDGSEIHSSSYFINKQILNKDFVDFISGTNINVDVLCKKIDALKKVDIKLAGETIVDKYIYGKVLGKSSKYPTLAFEEERQEEWMGGIYSVGIQISGLVNEVEMHTNLPSNAFDNIRIAGYNHMDFEKVRYIESSNNVRLFELYNFKKQNGPRKNFRPITNKNFYVIDYGHGLLNGGVCGSVCCQLNAGNKGKNSVEKYTPFSNVVLNKEELSNEVYVDVDDNNLEEMVQCLYTKPFFIPKSIVVTLGSKGCYLYERYRGFKGIIPSLYKGNIDTIGSGDTFFIVFSVLFRNGFSAVESAIIANLLAYKQANTRGHMGAIDSDDLKRSIQTIFK